MPPELQRRDGDPSIRDNTIRNILARLGMSLEDLFRLNPALEAAYGYDLPLDMNLREFERQLGGSINLGGDTPIGGGPNSLSLPTK